MKQTQKKSLSIILLALAALLFVSVAVLYIPSFKKVDAETSDEPHFKDEYFYGDTVDIPDLPVTVNDKQVKSTHKITYPNGKTSTAKSLYLDMAGEYSVEYTAIVDGRIYRETYEFYVKAVAYTFNNGESSAIYGKYTDFGANSTGLLVRLANNDTMTFTQLIDVKDSTSVDTFIKGFITPDTRGAADFNKLIITLTDSKDESVYLTYQIKRILRDGIALGVSFVTANGNGQDAVGAEGAKIHTNDEYGTPLYISFVAQRNGDGWSSSAEDYKPDERTFGLAYDASTNSAYSSGTKVADMDDTNFYRTLWYGFPSGKAKLSVSASGYNSVTANFCLTEVAGVSAQQLKENTFTETDAPEITIDVDDESNMPKAQKNLYYPIPSATAYDLYSGDCNVSVAVYYNYGKTSQITVGIVGGKFKPAVEGDYVIEYSAKDNFGNIAKKALLVRAETTVNDVVITIGDHEEELTLGEVLAPAEVSTSGGSGKISLKTYVVFDGKEEELVTGYRPEKAGEYTVKYAATDYIGKTSTKTYTVTMVKTDTPILAEKIVLPKIYISGAEYSLPEVSVNVYSTGELEKKAASFRITDKNGEKTYAAGSRFTPEVAGNNDKVKVECVYNDAVVYTAEVPAIIAKVGSQIRTDHYFYGAEEISTKDENGAVYKKGLASVINSACSQSGWMFANPLVAEGLNLKLKTVKNLTEFDSFTFTLTDSLDENQSISVTVPTLSGADVLCGSKIYESSFSLSVGADINFELSAGTLTITSGSGKVVISLTEYANGKEFNGFSSDKVYMELTANNVTDKSRYIIEEISGDVISRMFGDYSAPMFVLPETDNAKQTIGTRYTFVAGVCGDVFAPNTSVKMTVYAPDGTIVSDINGVKIENVSPFTDRTVLLSKTGKYRASYDISEVDWAGNSWTYAYVVNVPDKVAPTIKFADGGTKTAKVGDSVKVPSFTVSDNVTEKDKISVDVFVINPNGRLIYLENNAAIKCEYAGEYTFIVYAADMVETVGADGSVTLKQGNIATARYTVTVGE